MIDLIERLDLFFDIVAWGMLAFGMIYIYVNNDAVHDAEEAVEESTITDIEELLAGIKIVRDAKDGNRRQVFYTFISLAWLIASWGV